MENVWLCRIEEATTFSGPKQWRSDSMLSASVREQHSESATELIAKDSAAANSVTLASSMCKQHVAKQHTNSHKRHRGNVRATPRLSVSAIESSI